MGNASTDDTTWDSAYQAMSHDFKLGSDGLGVFAINLRFGLDDIQAIAAESITGGGDDKKCDVLYVDRERQIAVVAQCYASEKKKSSAPANKASDLNTALSWILGADIDTLPLGLQGRAEELRSAIDDGDIKQFHIWYVHNLPESSNVEKELKTVEQTAQRLLEQRDINIFSSEIGNSTLENLYQQAERTVIVTDSLQTVVPDAVELEGKNWASVVTTVKGTWLFDLFAKYGRDLFSANVRGYLGSRESDSNINNGIKKSAELSPGDFYVYNNGVTALVLDYTLGRRQRGRRNLSITGISIVNGAQTTGSLGSLPSRPDNSLDVPIRFIKSTDETLMENVVRFNNSQNKIQAADFRSTDSIQEALRRQFQAIPDAEYEGGRRGGASDAIKRSKNALPSYTVGQALAAFHGDPVTAYNKKSDIWTSEKLYRQFFTERTTARHIVFCYSLLDTINQRKIDLTGKQREEPDSLTEQEKVQLEFLSKKGAPFLIVYCISQTIETILGRRIANRFDVHFKANLSPIDATKIWDPVLNVILSLSKQLDGAFVRNRISNEGIRQTVPIFRID
ncbi:AIPR family protein [Gordonia sp. NPDC003425]